jgi:hypothetical protein
MQWWGLGRSMDVNLMQPCIADNHQSDNDSLTAAEALGQPWLIGVLSGCLCCLLQSRVQLPLAPLPMLCGAALLPLLEAPVTAVVP